MLDNIITYIPADYVPIKDVCYELGIAQITLVRWYNWYQDNVNILPANFPHLPNYYRKTKRGIRYFKPEDVDKIKLFAANVKHGNQGFMASENRKYDKTYVRKTDKF